VETVRVDLIKDVILHVPRLESALRGGNARLRLINEGWGVAREGTLHLAYAIESRPNHFQVVQRETFAIPLLDDEYVVDLNGRMPPITKWKKVFGGERELRLFATFRYMSDESVFNVETFSTSVFTGTEGGGSIGPAATYLVVLPLVSSTIPQILPLSDCVAPRSATKVLFSFTSPQSARFFLKLRLQSTEGIFLEDNVQVDVLVPRFEYVSKTRTKELFTGATRAGGCT
jgi:hypothetical protein